MTRVYRWIVLFPALAVLSACGSSATAPGTGGSGGTPPGGGNGNPTTTNYAGVFASPAATGSFTVKIVSPASGDVVAGSTDDARIRAANSIRPRSGSGSSITLTVVLLNQTVLTLSGSMNGTSFTVSDDDGDHCSGSVTNILNATCFFAVEGGADVNLLAVLTAESVFGGLTTYCGVETPPNSVTPDATVLLGIWGVSSATVSAIDTSFIARVSASSNALSFYLGRTATFAALADTGVSSDTVFTGTNAGNTWSGADANASGIVGNWTATTPCQLYQTSASGGGAVTFSAPVNTTPASQTVTITPSTVGPMTVVVPTSATWLTATASGNTVTVSVAPQATGGATLTATLNVWPQFAKNAPIPIAVTYNVTGGAGAITITSPEQLPSAVDLIPYSYQLNATGGPTGHYVWSLQAGSQFVSWLSMSPSGLITGTAPAGWASPVNFVLTVTDGTSSASQPFQLTVFKNVTITSTSPLPTASVSVPYVDTLRATGGPTPSYGWALAPGSALPSWLRLGTNGVLIGTPPIGAATPATFSITVASGGSTAVMQFTLAIQTIPPVVITTTTLPSPATVGVPYGPVQLTATGGPTPAHYAWALSAGSNLLPAGLSLSTSGVINGTPTAPTPTPTPSFAITVANGGGTFTAEQAYTIAVNAASSCTITTATLGPLNVGLYASIPLDFTAGCGSSFNFEWNVTGSVPAGLSIPPDENVITGTPTATGPYNFTLSIISSSLPGGSPPLATQSFSGTVGAETACEIGPVTLPPGTVGQSYSQELLASEACTNPGDDPTLWSWGIGATAPQVVPPGLNLSVNTSGVSSIPFFGTPTAAGTYTFTITFNEGPTSGFARAEQMYTVTIAPATSGSAARVRSTTTSARAR